MCESGSACGGFTLTRTTTNLRRQSYLEWWMHGDNTHVSNHGGGDVLRDVEAQKACDVETQEVICESHRRVKD